MLKCSRHLGCLNPHQSSGVVNYSGITPTTSVPPHRSDLPSLTQFSWPPRANGASARSSFFPNRSQLNAPNSPSQTAPAQDSGLLPQRSPLSLPSVRTLSGFIPSTGVHPDPDPAPTASGRGSLRPHLPLRVSLVLCSSLPRDRSPHSQASSTRARVARRAAEIAAQGEEIQQLPADVPGDRVGRARSAPSPRTPSDPTDHGRLSVRHRRRAVAPWSPLLLRSRSPQPATPRVPPALPAQPPEPLRLGLAAPLQTHHPHLSALRRGRVLTQSCRRRRDPTTPTAPHLPRATEPQRRA